MTELLYIIVPLAMFGIGIFAENRLWRYRMIKMKLARYHPTTGKWEWK